jgi:glutaredoxin
MTALLSRLFRRFRPASRLEFVVYSRKDCTCCHKAIDLLVESQRKHGFTLETIDVDDDPVRTALYGDSVPVVTVNGRVRFRGQVNPVLLERLLAGESHADDSPA